MTTCCILISFSHLIFIRTMAASFVGLPVLIQLRGGGTAKGIVAAVDGNAGTIQLEDGQFRPLSSNLTDNH